MNVETTFGTLTAGGWCIHGVPYGPNWACGQCGPTVPTTTVPWKYTPPDDETERLHRKLDRIIVLLEQIAGRTR